MAWRDRNPDENCSSFSSGFLSRQAMWRPAQQHRAEALERHFGLRRRASSRLRRVAAAMEGIDQRKLHLVGVVLAGRMQRVAMKKDRVAGRQSRRFGGAQQLRALSGPIGAEEPRRIEAICRRTPGDAIPARTTARHSPHAPRRARARPTPDPRARMTSTGYRGANSSGCRSADAWSSEQL
jgi:hypothetical protein